MEDESGNVIVAFITLNLHIQSKKTVNREGIQLPNHSDKISTNRYRNPWR